MIVEEAPLDESIHTTPLPKHQTHWLKVTGKTPIALRNLAGRYAAAIEQGVLRGADLSELAISANVGRSDWNHRAVVSYRTVAELIAGLREIEAHQTDLPAHHVDGDEEISKLMSSYLQGAAIDWPAVMGTRRRTLSLPTYPFERQRCWYRSGDESSASVVSPASSRGQSLLGSRLDLASDAIVFETDISGFVELADHRVGETSVFPAAGYLELASAAAKSLSAGSADRMCVSDLRLLRPLAWSAGQPMRVQVVVDAVTPGEYEAKVLSRQSSGWQLQATCKFTSQPAVASTSSPIESAKLEDKTISPNEHYDRCDNVGLRYSGVFRCLTSLSVSSSGADGEVVIPAEIDQSAYEFHPALLDGCFQGIAGLMSDPRELWLPVSIGRYEILSASLTSGEPLRFSIVESASPTSTTRQFDLTITTADQTLLARISQLMVKRVAKHNLEPLIPNGIEATVDAQSVKTCSHAADSTACTGNCTAFVADPMLIRLRQRLSAIIECDETELDIDTPLENLGFDSMMAIEMLDTLEKDFGVKIPTDQFWSGLTLGGLLERVRNQPSNSSDTGVDAIQWVEGTL